MQFQHLASPHGLDLPYGIAIVQRPCTAPDFSGKFKTTYMDSDVFVGYNRHRIGQFSQFKGAKKREELDGLILVDKDFYEGSKIGSPVHHNDDISSHVMYLPHATVLWAHPSIFTRTKEGNAGFYCITTMTAGALVGFLYDYSHKDLQVDEPFRGLTLSVEKGSRDCPMTLDNLFAQKAAEQGIHPRTQRLGRGFLGKYFPTKRR